MLRRYWKCIRRFEREAIERMNCKFCNSQTISAKKYSSPYVKYEYTLYQCKTCKCRFFDINEHNVVIEKVYEEYSIKHNKAAASFQFKKSFYWDRQVWRIEKILGRKVSSVLDIGCRTGDFLIHFPYNLFREGVELSKNSAEIAKSRGLIVYQDFVENINFDKQYDVVTCYAILEHLVNPLNFLDKLSNIVSSGGVLVIMIPSYECFKRWMIDIFTSLRWHMYSPPQHLNFFSKQFLDRCLAKMNFKLVDRYWTSGGMFNPFRNISLAGRAFGKGMSLIDEYTPVNKLSFFDHMYSYYVKIN
jgi:2-polyprenyl-3-methyl-5-hydroxy-6-metoxy-1,4-benzoquinol methylase